MSQTHTIPNSELAPAQAAYTSLHDVDPAETQEWLDSLEYVLKTKGTERVKFLLEQLENKSRREGIELPAALHTPYINTIPAERQPRFPGNRELERRIKSIVRWNAMAMVVRANKQFEGLGGHISTFASSATLYEIGFNHFFRGRGAVGYSGDQVYFQGLASPGMYSRAFLERRLI
jgi:pyruvate dehydrogenase E1 component